MINNIWAWLVNKQSFFNHLNLRTETKTVHQKLVQSVNYCYFESEQGGVNEGDRCYWSLEGQTPAILSNCHKYLKDISNKARHLHFCSVEVPPVISPQGHSVWPFCPAGQAIDKQSASKFLIVKW